MTCELSLVFNIYFLGQRSGQPGSFKDIKPSDSSGKQPFSAQHWTPSPVVCRWVWGGKKEYFLYFCLGEENCIEEIFFFFVDDFHFVYFVIMKCLIWDQRELVSKRPVWYQEVEFSMKRSQENSVHLRALWIFTMWSIKVGLNVNKWWSVFLSSQNTYID